MNIEAVIGIEIHVELKTKSKMFSAAPSAFSKTPNTNVAPLDMAFPGTMPVVNRQAVVHGIRVAHALHMEIARTLTFDRKNYFYADLPKGFQITQRFHPLGKEGYVTIFDLQNQPKKIAIERLHLEEDTCKQLHFRDYSLLDYNRAGVPLLEIVSYPDIHNGVEAVRYIEAVRNIVVYSLASDGKMEEGSLRCDVNVSIHPQGASFFGPKVELKNLNSLKNIQNAIDYEIARQSQCLASGVAIVQDTRRYDEAKGKTVSMRLKTEAIDYKYFPEPNILPIFLSEAMIEEAIATCPELYEAKKERYERMGLTTAQAGVLLSDPAMASYFEAASEGSENPKTIANLLIVEVNAYLNKAGNGANINRFPLPPVSLKRIAAYQEDGYTHQQCVEILAYCLREKARPEDALVALGITKADNDEEVIAAVVETVLAANPQSVSDFQAGKDRALSFLVGQAVKAAKGTLNPGVLAKALREKLAKEK